MSITKRNGEIFLNGEVIKAKKCFTLIALFSMLFTLFQPFVSEIVYARSNEGNGSVSVLKIDEDSGEGLEGVELSIETEHGNKVDNKTTDEKGMATFDGLPSGKYNIKELNTADGYLLDENIYEVVVEKNKTTELEIGSEKEIVEEEIVAEEIVEEEIVAEETKDEIVEEEIVEDEIDEKEIDKEEIDKEEKELEEVTLVEKETKDESTDLVIISQNYNDDKREFFTEDRMTHYVNVATSGNETVLHNYTVRLRMDSEFANINSVSVSGLTTEHEVNKYEKDGEIYVDIVFARLTASSIGIPIVTGFKNDGSTPEGYELDIKAEVIDNKGEFYKSADEIITFKAKYQRFNVEKKVGEGTSHFVGAYGDNNEFFPYPNRPVEFTFDVKYGGYATTKHRKIEKFRFTDFIPEGFTFNPEINKEWTLSEDGTKVIYEREYENGSFEKISRIPSLFLDYENQVVGTKSEENIVELEVFQHNKKEYEPIIKLTDSVKVNFTTEQVGRLFQKYGYNMQDIPKERAEQKWGYRISQPAISKGVKNFVIEDYKQPNGSLSLDEGFHFKKIETSSSNYDAIEVYAFIDENGTKVKVEGEITPNYRVEFNLPENTKGFRVEGDFGENYRYWGNREDLITAYTSADDPSRPLVINGVRQIKNQKALYEFGFATDSGDVFELSSRVNGTIQVREFIESIFINKSNYRYGNDGGLVGDSIQFDIRPFSNRSKLYDERVLKNVKIVDLLPIGLDFLRISSPNNRHLQYFDSYETIDNYKNTGRTAIVMNLKDMTVEELLVAAGNQPFDQIGVTIHTKINLFSSKTREENLNELFIDFGDSLDENVKIMGSQVKDIHDINNNGDTDELVHYSSADYWYTPPFEVSIRNYIRTQNGGWGQNIITKPDDVFDYRINLYNANEYSSIENVVVYDVLPKKGDTAIVENENGEYLNRGSVFSNTLTGQADAPEGFTVYYTTDEVVEDASKAMDELNWQTTLSDYSQATAIKIVMDEGVSIAPEEQKNFVLEMKAPSEGVKTGQRAYNSSAFSENNLTFKEGNKVYNEIYIPMGNIEVSKVDSETKEPLANVGFELFDGEEMIAEGETDSDGKLLFENLKVDKEYIVKEVKPLSGYAQNDTEYPITVKENETHVIEIENEKIRFTNIDIEKIWKGTPLEEISVDLLADGEVIKTVVLNDGNEWKHTFKELDITNAETGEEIEYTVKEEHLDDYRVSIKGDKEKGFTITNREVGRPILPDTGGLGAMAIIAVVGGLVFIGWRKNKKEE